MCTKHRGQQGHYSCYSRYFLVCNFFSSWYFLIYYKVSWYFWQANFCCLRFIDFALQNLENLMTIRKFPIALQTKQQLTSYLQFLLWKFEHKFKLSLQTMDNATGQKNVLLWSLTTKECRLIYTQAQTHSCPPEKEQIIIKKQYNRRLTTIVYIRSVRIDATTSDMRKQNASYFGRNTLVAINQQPPLKICQRLQYKDIDNVFALKIKYSLLLSWYYKPIICCFHLCPLYPTSLAKEEKAQSSR